MRSVKRIKPFCEKLRGYWESKIPDWRFGQFMSNFLGWVMDETKRDFFFMEEDEMSEYLDRFFTEKV